ncbi:MAG: LacI family transcriptional regulator [Propionibacteriaceae bacterium]|nr:LacI family transcriptional regulator [Propionibacteriaceae bacterium]
MPMARPIGQSPVTLHDVAREAGVSLATASRAINGSERKVKQDYRERVLAAAARLNYKPNRAAQAVARGSTMTVALLVGDIADPYFSSIAAGVISASEEAGLVVTMAATQRDPDRELDLVRAMVSQRPKILVVAGSRLTDDPNVAKLVDELTAFEASGGRVVMISQPELPFNTVVLDNVTGARQLAEHLLDLGYRSFAIISGAPTLMTSNERVQGFLDGLGAAGISIADENIVSTEFTRDGGYAGAQQLMESGLDQIELIFAVNDVMAVGAMSALREAGRELGTDIAVAGYDDIPTVQDVTPTLTTMRLPLVEVGRSAIQLAHASPPGLGPARTEISAAVILRASTPRIR